MEYKEEKYSDVIIKHYENNWGGEYQKKLWTKGDFTQLSKNFCVLEVPINVKRKMWTYATCGMSSFDDTNPIEIHIFSESRMIPWLNY